MFLLGMQRQVNIRDILFSTQERGAASQPQPLLYTSSRGSSSKLGIFGF